MLKCGTTVPHMLLAGACADVTSSHGGAFALHEGSPSSDTWWTDGSAKKIESMQKKKRFRKYY